MVNDLRKLKDEFEKKHPKPTKEQTIDSLSRQLALLEKHTIEDESMNSMGLNSKTKPQELVKEFKLSLTEPDKSRIQDRPKSSFITGYQFSVLCELVFALLVVFSGLKMGLNISED